MTELSPQAAGTFAMISATGSGFLTAEQGQELVQAGFITVDPSQVSPDNPLAFLCTVTEVGKQAAVTPAEAAAPAVAAAPVVAPTVAETIPAAPPVTAPVVAPVTAPVPAETVAAPSGATGGFNIRADVVMPKIVRTPPSNANRPEKYPFSQLEIGQSFHVAVGAGEDIDKIARKMSTQCSKANKASRVPVNPPQTKEVEKKEMIKDAEGKPVLDANGKKTYTKKKVVEQVTEQTKFFASRKTDGNDPEGVGVRVFRITAEQAAGN